VNVSGVQLSNQPENWQNTLRYSIGASYRYTDNLKLRVGAAYDESPVSDAYRTPRIPDNHLTWMSAPATSYRPAAVLARLIRISSLTMPR